MAYHGARCCKEDISPGQYPLIETFFFMVYILLSSYLALADACRYSIGEYMRKYNIAAREGEDNGRQKRDRPYRAAPVRRNHL